MPPRTTRTQHNQPSPTADVHLSEPSLSAPDVPQVLSSDPPVEGSNSLRPARSRRLPLRFRAGDTALPEEEEENFDLSNVNSDEEPAIPRANGAEYADDLQTSMTPDPLMTTQSSQKQASSADVMFFFPKRKGEPTTCTVCQ